MRDENKGLLRFGFCRVWPASKSCAGSIGLLSRRTDLAGMLPRPIRGVTLGCLDLLEITYLRNLSRCAVELQGRISEIGFLLAEDVPTHKKSLNSYQRSLVELITRTQRLSRGSGCGSPPSLAVLLFSTIAALHKPGLHLDQLSRGRPFRRTMLALEAMRRSALVPRLPLRRRCPWWMIGRKRPSIPLPLSRCPCRKPRASHRKTEKHWMLCRR